MHTKITPLSIGRGRYLYVLLFIRRELSLVFSLQAAQAGFQLGDALVDNIRQIMLVQIVRRAALDIADADDVRGYTEQQWRWRAGSSAQRCPRRRGRYTDVDRAQHLRARADQHIVAQRQGGACRCPCRYRPG